jgi:hypothetical protein
MLKYRKESGDNTNEKNDFSKQNKNCVTDDS